MHVPGDILGIVIWMVEMIRSAHVDILWFYIYFFIWLCQVLVAAYRSLVFVMACRIFSYSMWDLTRGSNPGPPVLEIQSLSHLTTRKVPQEVLLHVQYGVNIEIMAYLLCFNFPSLLIVLFIHIDISSPCSLDFSITASIKAKLS